MSDSAPWATTALETTIPRLLDRNATEFPDLPALTDEDGAGARTWTWSEVRGAVHALAAGLSGLGLRPGQTMLIMAPNRAEHWLIDAAATHLGAVPSTLYDTLSSDQVLFAAQHSRARVAVLHGADQVRRWSAALRNVTALEHLVVLDAEAAPPEDSRFLSWRALESLGSRQLHEDASLVDRHVRAVVPADPATVLYTSGTTGDSKGVVLNHRNVVYAAASLQQVVQAPQHASMISYLPLAHIAQRALAFYFALHNASHVHFCADPQLIGAALAAVRPHLFFGVPRVWEKLAAARARARGNTASLLGLDRLHWSASGAAPIGREVLDGFAEIGVPIYELWGMTETSGCVTVNRPSALRPGTVGQTVPGVEISTDSDGEVLVRGPLVCAGYLQPDGAVLPVTDADGWFRTGDVGRIEDGFLTITERKKELLIDSYGKNIAPSAVETALKTHPLIGNALAYGDGRPYLVALLVLDEEAAPRWARANGIAFRDLANLAAHPAVLSAVERAVERANAQLNRAEQVKRYRLLDHGWTSERGELTPTSKLRRHVIHERYSDVLDDLYT